jgi:hypothetical protein
MTNIHKTSYSDSAVELFHEQIDALNFEGYAAMLAAESPQLYNFEKEQFLRMYCEPIIYNQKQRK